MLEFISLLTYLLSAHGLAVLVVWPSKGPSAWLREKVVRRFLPRAARGVLDCYICTGFWSALILSPLWWHFYHAWWVWAGCLMTSGIFWILLGNPKPTNEEQDELPPAPPPSAP
jgi:hypothetical protein